MGGNSLLPPEFYTLLKISAISGFFAMWGIIVGVAYKFFKLILGEEKAKKYRWSFVVGNIPLLFILLYIFLVLF